MVNMNLMRPATMEECHALLLDALKYLDDICTKEGITYYAAYGTLLGAVREHGFILWDGDADVWMKREDYEKFSEAIKKYPDSRFFFQSVETDEGFFLPFLMRVCVNDSFSWNERFKSAPFHMGFHIDIYPLDYGWNTDQENEKKLLLLQFLHHKIFYSVKNKFRYVRSLRNIAGMIVKALPLKILSLRQWINVYKRVLRNDSPDKSILINTAGGYKPEHEIFKAELFNETTELSFEDMMIKCPARYDELLTQIYGDYMTPYNRGRKQNLWVKA